MVTESKPQPHTAPPKPNPYGKEWCPNAPWAPAAQSRAHCPGSCSMPTALWGIAFSSPPLDLPLTIAVSREQSSELSAAPALPMRCCGPPREVSPQPPLLWAEQTKGPQLLPSTPCPPQQHELWKGGMDYILQVRWKEKYVWVQFQSLWLLG